MDFFVGVKEDLFGFLRGNLMLEPIFVLVTFIPDKFNWLFKGYHGMIVYTGLHIVKGDLGTVQRLLTN